MSWKIISYYWDFGDGETSTEQNPLHVFYDVNIPVVTLTITDDTGQSSVTTYAPHIISNFVHSVAWDFGDGETSTELSPVHVYSINILASNWVTVTYTLTDIYGFTESVTERLLIPAIGFFATATPSSGKAPLEVRFSV